MTPALEATPTITSTAATTASTTATSSSLSTAATATLGVGAAVGLSSDSPDSDDQQERCETYPLGFHRGPNTNGHHDCADKHNIYPGSDVQVDSPIGSKAFDALDATGTLWEIKTDRYSTWKMPPFLKKTIVKRDAAEMLREQAVATECGYPFMIGVVDPDYAAALIAVDPLLPAASIAC